MRKSRCTGAAPSSTAPLITQGRVRASSAHGEGSRPITSSAFGSADYRAEHGLVPHVVDAGAVLDAGGRNSISAAMKRWHRDASSPNAARTDSRLLRWPVATLSRAVTSWPSASGASIGCEPMNPAAPVASPRGRMPASSGCAAESKIRAARPAPRAIASPRRRPGTSRRRTTRQRRAWPRSRRAGAA